MKLHNEGAKGRYTVTGYDRDHLEINLERRYTSLLLMPDRLEAWDKTRVEDLTPADFEQMLSWKPEIVLLGTGLRQRFPHPALYACLASARIGVDTMDVLAASRTYNILSAEGRRVLAALMLDAQPPAAV